MERRPKIKCVLCGKKIEEVDAKALFNEVQNGNVYCEECFDELG